MFWFLTIAWTGFNVFFILFVTGKRRLSWYSWHPKLLRSTRTPGELNCICILNEILFIRQRCFFLYRASKESPDLPDEMVALDKTEFLDLLDILAFPETREILAS